MAIEIVSFPIDSLVIFHSYINLPERISDDQSLVKTDGFSGMIFGRHQTASGTLYGNDQIVIEKSCQVNGHGFRSNHGLRLTSWVVVYQKSQDTEQEIP